MSVPQNRVDAAVSAARELERHGFFARVKQGDERAASYFARLVAYTVNPSGFTSDFGWLRKTAGGFNIEGYADGAIVFGADPNDLHNVIKIVTQVGSTNAGIGSAEQERRVVDVWEAPKPLTLEQMRYLNPAYEPLPDVSQPPPGASMPSPIYSQGEIGVLLQHILKRLDAMEQKPQPTITVDLSGVSAQIADVRHALSNGLAIDAQGRIPFVGTVTLKGSAKG